MTYELMENFLKYYKSLNKSPDTIRNYRSDLQQFHKYLIEVKGYKYPSKNFYENIKAITINDFTMYLSELGKQPATRIRKIDSILSFMKYLYRYEVIDKLIVKDDIDKPVLEKRVPVFMDEQESVNLIRSVKKSSKIYSERNHCIVGLFLTTGIRVSELINIQLTDIQNGILKVHGKGKKERNIDLTPSIINALEEYIDWRNSRNIIDTDYLFISRSGRRLNKEAVESLIKDYKGEADIKKDITPHKLRHTVAALLRKEGNDVRTIQDILGHANITTTQIYTHVYDEEKKKAINSNPLANII